MNRTDLVKAIKERLHPKPYSGLLQTGDSPFDLVLSRRHGRLTYDVFGILELAPGQDVRSRIEEARSDVARRFGWLCDTTEIAMNLLLHGPVDQWWDQIGRLSADRTGFRGVMRSVCVVDPLLGSRFSCISGWGKPRGTGADIHSDTAAASELLTAIEPLLAVVRSRAAPASPASRARRSAVGPTFLTIGASCRQAARPPPVRGTRDLLARRVRAARLGARGHPATYRSRGFARIETPALEHLALLSSGQGGEQREAHLQAHEAWREARPRPAEPRPRTTWPTAACASTSRCRSRATTPSTSPSCPALQGDPDRAGVARGASAEGTLPAVHAVRHRRDRRGRARRPRSN